MTSFRWKICCTEEEERKKMKIAVTSSTALSLREKMFDGLTKFGEKKNYHCIIFKKEIHILHIYTVKPLFLCLCLFLSVSLLDSPYQTSHLSFLLPGFVQMSCGYWEVLNKRCFTRWCLLVENLLQPLWLSVTAEMCREAVTKPRSLNWNPNSQQTELLNNPIHKREYVCSYFLLCPV